MLVDAASAENIIRADFGSPAAPGRIRRLSEETRGLAAAALSGAYGREMRKSDFTLKGSGSVAPNPNLRYAAACLSVAEHAPLGIRPHELLVGNAPLLESAFHQTPLLDVSSTSHTTIDFPLVLHEGTRGIRRRIAAAREEGKESEAGLYDAMDLCLDAMALRHRRYMAALDGLIDGSADALVREHWTEVRSALATVPEYPPETFRQAVQSLWFAFSFQRLMGNWSGIGRIDLMLGPYLSSDLARGRITIDEARELLAHFWIKGCEWIGANPETGSGDAQHYQNIVLSGSDRDGGYILNQVTSLVLDIVEELHISDFPVAVRVGKRTPSELYRRIAEIQRLGGGIVSVYNEDLVMSALEEFGFPPEDACTFANDGCWEVLIPGKTAFGYHPFDALRIFQETLGLTPDGDSAPEFASFESLYAAFIGSLERKISEIQRTIDGAFSDGTPTPLLSMFVDGCIENGRSYRNRGAVYTVLAPHAGGLPDVANSLLAIEHLVYGEGRMTLGELVELAASDWEGHEPERLRIWNGMTFYGNGDPDADAMFRRLFDDYTAIVAAIPRRAGVWRPAGISTFGREASAFLPFRTATVFGKKRGEILAPNMSPTPGTDRGGPTSMIRSYCSVDFRKLPNGTPLDLKIHPSALMNDSGIEVLASLLETFIRGGGWYLQVDAVDTAVLREAQKHPERYPNLTVRISGWSARFATLSPEWQELVIQRTEHTLNAP